MHPLPAQERILDAFHRLGFPFKNADVQRGHIYGINQTLPFYQEIEFYPPPQYRGITEVELTFVADPYGVDVILEFDKRSGFLSSGHDVYGRFRVEHATVDRTDWTAVVDGWVRQAADRYAGMLDGYGMHGYPPGYRGHGAGAMAAGVAGGLLGGMIIGEAMDDAFEGDDDFGGDFGDVGDFGGD